MSDYYKEVEFNVMICLGGGDGGEICVDVPVTKEEYDLMLQCCREDEEIEGYAGLDDLYERVREYALDEDSSLEAASEEDEDYEYESNASIMLYMPDEIYNIVEQEG